MKRRTISIDGKLEREIAKLAKKEKRSFSAMISELAGKALAQQRQRFAFFGSGDSGISDLSERLEEYLAEDAKRWDD
ncbi:MAG: hypothetical protein ACRDJM_04660 [Actinomycetota bacterium]